MSSKNPPPLFVPRNGERYRLVIMRVLDVYEDRPEVGGRPVPAELLFLDDDDFTEVTDGARYITAYVPECVFGKAPRKGDPS